MAKWIRGAAQHLSEEYSANARNIWDQAITAGEVVERLFLVPGISFKKAHMATRILHESDHAFCRRFKRWDQINVAVDSLVRRVWLRSGLTRDGSTRGIMAAASVLHPRYPGELDYPSWLIGREWCHRIRPACQGRDGSAPCPLSKLCPRIGVR
jgi:endonuclease III